mgnify:CR=1 FL=1
MTKFFKGIGKGILYIIGFPFLIVGLALATVVSLVIFFCQFGKLIFLFFTGRNLFSDLDEDIKAKAILERESILNERAAAPQDPMSLYPSNAPVYGSGYSSPIMEEPKAKPEEEHEILDEPQVEQENLLEEEDE